VSVLFVDLVGFTTISEARDSEEARELLSRYSELARTLIKRYGGTIEKFIGDAVMAVWGTPTATEDDAERAVRAALDLVASVPELDPALQARAGVLTGPPRIRGRCSSARRRAVRPSRRSSTRTRASTS
jgi:class 3 adenylate cyclase